MISALVPRPNGLEWIGQWSVPVLTVGMIAVAAALYVRGVRSVRDRTPGTPWPKGRSVAFGVGLALLFVAAVSPIGTYEDALFSVHMVQHLLIVMIAAPLLMAAAPVTLAIRASTPGFRRKVLLPFLRSKPVEFLTNPVVAWLLFASVLWGAHFTPLFDAALRNDWWHEFEHALFLGSACLFWWAVLGVDPSRWKLPYPAKVLYLFLAMPLMAFLGMVILEASEPLYPTYAATARVWGIDALADQHLAAFLMWVPSGLITLTVMLVVVGRWMRSEEERAKLVDARLDRIEAEKKKQAGVDQPSRRTSTAIEAKTSPR
jgi:putative membrane protein